MKTQHIRELFKVAFENQEIFKVRLIPDIPLHYEYHIYPLSCLSDLRDSVKSNATDATAYTTENDEFLMNYAARFVVTTAGDIKFTREGARSKSIPAHSDMARTVLTAGNIHFSEDYSKIVKITNKSGHFRPTFESLVFALPIILDSNFPLAEEITLVNETTQEEFTLTQAQLCALIPDEYDFALSRKRNASTEIFIDTPEPRGLPALANRTIFAASPTSAFSPFSAASTPSLAESEFEGGYESPNGDETCFSPLKRRNCNTTNA